MDPRWRNVKPRPRPKACGNCSARKLTAHCVNPACPWSQCSACKYTTGSVLGKTQTTAGIAVRCPGKET